MSVVKPMSLLEASGQVFRSRDKNGKLRFFRSEAAAAAHTQAIADERAVGLAQAVASRAAHIKDLADRKEARKAHKAKVAASRAASQAWVGGKGAPPPMLPGSDKMRDPMRKKNGPPELMRYTAGASKLAAPITGDVDTSRAIITIAPVPLPYRHSVDPASMPFGAGFAAAGIGRSVATGRAWE